MSLFPRTRYLPEPDPRCRTYNFAQTVELFRNHETQFRQSEELYGREYERQQTAPDPSYFKQHSYAELSGGY